jgi:hypothetical protein
MSPEAHLTLNGWNVPFFNHARYLGAIFDTRMELTEAKAFRRFTTIYYLFIIENLIICIKLTLHNALIRSIMMYACPVCKLATDT